MINLRTEITVFAPVERCFDLARSVEMHISGAAPIYGKAIAGRTAGLSEQYDRTTWSARFFGMRFTLTTEITEFDYPRSFSDVMCRGMFAHFGHRYSFQPLSEAQTLMTDKFSFESPLGILGRLFDRIILRPRMQAAADFRALTLKRVAESEQWRRYLPCEERHGKQAGQK